MNTVTESTPAVSSHVSLRGRSAELARRLESLNRTPAAKAHGVKYAFRASELLLAGKFVTYTSGDRVKLEGSK